jgi:hypothetical protein
MTTLMWLHTRKRTPMKRAFASQSQALLTVLYIRSLFPQHPFQLDGVSI